MRISILTLFPEMFTGVFSHSILKQAQEKQIVSYDLINFRDYTTDRHNRVDDYPYGGGGGMVLTPQPIFDAVDAVKANQSESKPPRVILLCPQGKPYTQRIAEELAKEEHLIVICGHYEGYDERIRQHIVTDEISIGDFVLTGGEVGAMAIADSVTRLLPGALGNDQSAVTDSYSTGLLEYPHYTRPAQFRDLNVPDVLLSGHHERINNWRREQSLKRTYERRPEMLDKSSLTKQDHQVLKKIKLGKQN